MGIFNTVQVNKTGINKFDLSHDVKMSFNMGELIPFFWSNIIPNDHFRVNSEVFIRFAPMVAPIMHRINVWTHFFWVPLRLIWNQEDFDSFITGGEDGLDATVWPFFKITDAKKARFAKGRVGDYLGIPTTDDVTTLTQEFSISQLPFRAYQLIYNEFYRDQNLISEIDFGTDSGEQTSDTYYARLTSLRRRAWEKDYFTSALPWAQRGAEVDLDMDITLKSIAQFLDSTGADYSGGNVRTFEHSTTGQLRDTTDNVSGNLETIETISMTINNLRQAVRIQEWLERQARAGARYAETVLSHFGIRTDDNRIDRPAFLGGGVQNVNIGEVLQTSEAGTTPQGEMTGHGISVGGNHFFKKKFNEHGIVMGIISVMPKSAYQQGISRHWTMSDKFDYPWPEFAHLGEQEVYQREIMADYENASSTEQDTVFGYQSRYAQWKTEQSRVAGDFRDDFEYWHLGRQFASNPALNQSFIECDPSHRIFAVTTSTIDKIWCHVYNKVDALRPLPYYGTPRM